MRSLPVVQVAPLARFGAQHAWEIEQTTHQGWFFCRLISDTMRYIYRMVQPYQPGNLVLCFLFANDLKKRSVWTIPLDFQAIGC
jgi:hypothetical protein